MHVSHETIYQAPYVLQRNALKTLLIGACLRQQRRHRRPPGKRVASNAPKCGVPGTSLSHFSQNELDGVAEKLNNGPRELLGWTKPNEAWAEALQSNVALDS
jgi:IS30 family transposase